MRKDTGLGAAGQGVKLDREMPTAEYGTLSCPCAHSGDEAITSWCSCFTQVLPQGPPQSPAQDLIAIPGHVRSADPGCRLWEEERGGAGHNDSRPRTSRKCGERNQVEGANKAGPTPPQPAAEPCQALPSG